ncbi:hypothetical protein BJV78DRAFT_1284327 [Lactifluus subvellereus]|nr:hypothetical protein BJV78DRAFT_1284327 [Lactifluus subvellereus]
MRTVKLAVVRNSGVGKMSLRSRVRTARPSLLEFANRHDNKDIAGQERFSSPSTAFFRGADAALLMAPLTEEDMEEYCLVVAGNKTDLISSSNGITVSEAAALRFIDDLVPPHGIAIQQSVHAGERG